MSFIDPAYAQARIHELEELLAGEADVCSVFFTRLHQRNRQLQSRIKAYEHAISLQVQSIFARGCVHIVFLCF